MGENAMRTLLQEHVDVIREALPAGYSYEDWDSDGNDFEQLTIGDDTHRESLAFSYGYIRGCADMIDVTTLSLLWDHEIDLSARGVAATPKKPRRKARHK